MLDNLARGSAATGGRRGYRGIIRLDECPNLVAGKSESAICEAFHVCHSCVTAPECEWSIVPKIAKCQKMKHRKHVQSHLPSGSDSQQKNNEVFQQSYEYERRYPQITRSGFDSNCNPACSDRTTCDHCLESSCMWCKNLRMCTDRNAYLVSFPYGQCMDWMTTGSCPVVSPKSNGIQLY